MRKLRSFVWCDECATVHDIAGIGAVAHRCDARRAHAWRPLYTIAAVSDSHERCQVRYERVQTGERNPISNRPIYHVRATCLCGWTTTETHRRDADRSGRAHMRGEL